MVDTNIAATFFLAIVGFLVYLFYWYFKQIYTYWETKNIPYLKPTIPFGNFSKVAIRQWTLGQAFGELYLELKRMGVKHGGVYALNRPVYMPIDPDIIKHIVISDSENFPNHGLYFNVEDDPLSGHIFNMEGNRWKDLRTKMPKAFTSARMKDMFHIMSKHAEELYDLLDTCRIKQTSINIKTELEKFSTDVISSCGYGLESNTLKGRNKELIQHARSFFDYQWNFYKNGMVFALPRDTLKKLNFRIFTKESTEYVTDMFRKLKSQRAGQGGHRHDLANIIINLTEKNEKNKDYSGKNVMEPLTENEYFAQMWVFFCANFETSSSTVTLALYELSRNLECQNKLRKEIEEVLEGNGKTISYEAVMEMKYLERVIDETLRIYPIFPILPRVCKEDYKIPGTDVVLEKNTFVMVSNYGLHRDPEYYPDPLRFDPERFTSENKGKRPFVSYLPFGEGPRICVGKRFGLLQAKLALLTIIKNFEVSLDSKTTTGVKFDPWQLILRKTGDVWINLKKLT